MYVCMYPLVSCCQKTEAAAVVVVVGGQTFQNKLLKLISLVRYIINPWQKGSGGELECQLKSLKGPKKKLFSQTFGDTIAIEIREQEKTLFYKRQIDRLHTLPNIWAQHNKMFTYKTD